VVAANIRSSLCGRTRVPWSRSTFCRIPRPHHGVGEQFSGRWASTSEEHGELGRVDLARPSEHPVARSEPGGIGVVGDGAALGRGEVDQGARRAPAGDRAPAFQVLDDALADHREQPPSFEPRTVTERIIGMTVRTGHYERVAEGARKERDDGGTGRRPVPPRVSNRDSFVSAQLK
jgi:hypothetical protein